MVPRIPVLDIARFDSDRGAPRSGFGAGRPAMRPRSNGPR